MDLINFFISGFLLLLKIIRGKRVPIQAHIRVTDNCNLHCSYCFANYPERGFNDPTTEQLKTLIKELRQSGTRRITLTGGEPLIRKDIREIVKYAHDLGLMVSLTTNGLLLKKHEDILPLLDQLTISVDDSKEVHELHRGKGVWDKVMDAIAFAKSKGSKVQIQCTITNATDYKLENLFKIADKYDCIVNMEIIAPEYTEGTGFNQRKEDITEENLKKLLNYQIENYNQRLVIGKKVMEYILKWPDFNKYRIFKGEKIPKDFKVIKCQAGIFSIIIDTDGYLLPCCRVGKEYKPLNTYKIGFKKAWKEMPMPACITCKQLGANMFNLIFNLDIPTISLVINKSIFVRPNSDFIEE